MTWRLLPLTWEAVLVDEVMWIMLFSLCFLQSDFPADPLSLCGLEKKIPGMTFNDLGLLLGFRPDLMNTKCQSFLDKLMWEMALVRNTI